MIPVSNMTRSPHQTRLRVRYGETDQMGVVHHANYLLYFEEGRTRMMADLGCSYAELERRGWILPVRKVQLRFRASARYEDEIVVSTWVGHLGGASVEFSYEVRDVTSGALLAEGSTELACMRVENGERKVALLPDDLRAVLEPARVGGAPAMG